MITLEKGEDCYVLRCEDFQYEYFAHTFYFSEVEARDLLAKLQEALNSTQYTKILEQV